MMTCRSGVAAARAERAPDAASDRVADSSGAATPVAAATLAAFKKVRRPNRCDTVRSSEVAWPSSAITCTSAGPDTNPPPSFWTQPTTEHWGCRLLIEVNPARLSPDGERNPQ